MALQQKNSSTDETNAITSDSMATTSPVRRIALLIKAKRRENNAQPLRAAADEAKISAATLSRLERGLSTTLPDATTLNKLARWLGVPVSELLQECDAGSRHSAPEHTLPEYVEVHLRADKNLSPKTAKALAEMFKALYEQAAAGGKRKK
jgi:transcriptional regulator with XRE-family HTH domain